MIDWFPRAESKPITVRQAIGVDGFIEYRHSYSVGRVSWSRSFFDRPCLTITKTGLGWRTYIGGEWRRFTLRELQTLASFPSDFRFLGSDKNAWAHIGNSVPPLMMRSIARNIRSMLQTGKPYRHSAAKQDYPSILNDAWQQHLAPRADDAPTVISTFAGCGGSSLGYSMAGFRELLAVEWDDNAVETFKLNFPGVPVYHGDIAKLSVKQALDMTGLQPGELDVFDGSPPCQGFSTAGKRMIDDPRNQLFREYVRLLRGLKPKVFVMENVSGMVKGKMKLIFAEILRELKDSGYRASARLLNAKYFHVPQSRERMIFIGVREDLDIEPSHPKAESKPIPVSAAIGDLDISGDTTLAQAENLQRHEVGKWVALCKPGEQVSKYHPRGTFFNTARIPLDRPCQTILSGMSLCHHSELRYLVASELKRLGSFPDQFRLVGTLQNAYNRIGNSVPPLMMRAIALHIRAEVLAARGQA